MLVIFPDHSKDNKFASETMEALKRIAIIGPESTGKSELAQQLAVEFDTQWVPEYARVYLDRLDREYEKKDLLEIARGQVAWEDDKAQYGKDWLFCDTNLIVIKIWSDHKYGFTDPWIEQELANRHYSYYLLNNTDLPWLPDPQREHPHKREYFFNVYEQYLKTNNLPYSVVSGMEKDRLHCALESLRKI